MALRCHTLRCVQCVRHAAARCTPPGCAPGPSAPTPPLHARAAQIGPLRSGGVGSTGVLENAAVLGVLRAAPPTSGPALRRHADARARAARASGGSGSGSSDSGSDASVDRGSGGAGDSSEGGGAEGS